MNFIREKKYICGDYAEIDIVHYSTEQERRYPRSKKQKVSRPAQQKLNDKNSQRYFRMLLNANFGKTDYHISLTYDEDHHPPDDEAALKQIKNYIRRLKLIYSKSNIAFDYVLVTEYGHQNGRVHHHVVARGGVPRELIEDAWGKGFVNVDRLQPDKKEGLAALAKYLTKDPHSGKHRWSASRGLKKPVVQINDNAYSIPSAARVANDISQDTVGGLMRLQRRYKKYQLSAVTTKTNPITGARDIYLMARRI